MEGCGDAGRTGKPVEMWGREMRPEWKATWSVEANVRGLGLQQQVPAHWPEGPRGSGHISRGSRAGECGPMRGMETFPLTPRNTAPRKKRKEGNAKQCKLTQK